MNINDRDLGIIGAGAFLTVLCLLFKWPFPVRIVVGLLILVIFMVVALMRFGPDKVTLEEFMGRRLKRSARPQKFSYRSQHQEQPEPARPEVMVLPASQVSSVPLMSPPDLSQTNQVASPPLAGTKYRPISFAWEEVGVYRLVTVFLAVVGVYFIYWLTQGGTEQMGRWMKFLFQVP